MSLIFFCIIYRDTLQWYNEGLSFIGFDEKSVESPIK
jgi:hypothetical protein